MVEAARKEISVIVPCFNEEGNIRACLESLLDDFTKETCEVIIVDGMSTDGTRRIVEEFQEKYDNIVMLSNPERLQAHALNIGIQHSRGRIIVRIDAHSVYPKDYVERCVQLLEEASAENVGGVMAPVGKTPFEEAVAIAMRHPLGIRSARDHGTTFKGYVDTVYLGTFRRDVFKKVGYFDPRAHPNEDGEMNLRIQNAGGKIFMDGSLEVRYGPRGSLRALARQYYIYGKGRAYTTLKHKKITAYRQVSPVPLVLGIGFSFGMAPFFKYSLVFPGIYLVSVLAMSVLVRDVKDVRVRCLCPLVFMTMHLSYGVGFIVRVLKEMVGPRTLRRSEAWL